MDWCQFISFMLLLVYVYFIYVWTGVTLYCLRLHWCQFVSSTFGVVSVYIIYVWTGVTLYCLCLYWHQLIPSTYGLVSVYTFYAYSGISLHRRHLVDVSLHRLRLIWFLFKMSKFGLVSNDIGYFCIGHMLHINREIIVLTYFSAMSKLVALLVQLVFVIVHLLTQHNLKVHSD